MEEGTAASNSVENRPEPQVTETADNMNTNSLPRRLVTFFNLTELWRNTDYSTRYFHFSMNHNAQTSQSDIDWKVQKLH